MRLSFSRRWVILWQLLFLILATSWLWAPSLNHLLSARTSLISQYENPLQPYSSIFRVCDVLAATLVIALALVFRADAKKRVASYLLLVIGLGMFIDPIMATTCQVKINSCQEYFSTTFLIHAIETVATSVAFFAIAIYDAWLRRRLVSYAFVVFQVGYFGLFISQLANQNHFNTLSQYLYQLILIVWTAWYIQDYIFDLKKTPASKEIQIVKYAVSIWAFLNGILAILISLADIHVFGRFSGFYFAGDNAWLAQHGVVVGAIMIYLSRQLARGEMRARQILLFIVGIETLKYSLITPNIPLMLTYFITFCLVFVFRDDFFRGSAAMTLRVRLKEAAFVIGGLTLSVLAAGIVLHRNPNVSRITTHAGDHFFDYLFGSSDIPRNHLRSVLLVHTASALLIAGIFLILWTLFKPNTKAMPGRQNYEKVEELLNKHSASSEDFFKLWPKDKLYFWNADKNGFIAYKIAGPVAFALAGPIAVQADRANLIDDFIAWARGRRLTVCFMPIYEDLEVYKDAGLETVQIGASAVINIKDFLNGTAQDKWWRWKKNRAVKKNGYEYSFSDKPYDHLISELRKISNSWLKKGGHKERCFALGYFDKTYLRKSTIHYLKDGSGKIIAFTNQLPLLNPGSTATIDLLRYSSGADDAMPYLLFKTIENLGEQGFEFFDLGFVPFTTSKDPLVALARLLSSGRFSAKGLEQFKNKFDPDWQPTYLAYDGDLADLAVIGVNLERLMELK
jgi:phosphatidylglycerol lysyltransferase